MVIGEVVKRLNDLRLKHTIVVVAMSPDFHGLIGHRDVERCASPVQGGQRVLELLHLNRACYLSQGHQRVASSLRRRGVPIHPSMSPDCVQEVVVANG